MTANVQAKLLDVIAKSWTDEDYKKRLLADPKTVLAEDGIEVPADAVIRVIDQKPDEWYLFIPPRPQAEINVRNVTSQVATSAGLTLPRPSHTTNMTLGLAGAALTEHGCQPHTTGMTERTTNMTLGTEGMTKHTTAMTERTEGMTKHTTAMTLRTEGMTDRDCAPHTAGMTDRDCAPHTAGMTDRDCAPHTAGMTRPSTAALTLLTIPPAAPGSGGTGGGQ